eukprot:2461463-Pyramimonas_sp.AAC.1
MKVCDPHRTYDWLRHRVLDVLEMKQLEKNQDKSPHENEDHSQVNICAAWNKGNCRNGDRCMVLHACSRESRDGRSPRPSH